jgi:hypothetical protein
MQEDKTAEAPATEDPFVAALLRERDGYVARGLDDRVSQVDEQLKLRGYNPSDTPKGAKGRRQQTRTTDTP